MTTTRIQLERTGGIATLWLDRAEKRNALDAAAMKELAAALDAAGGDRTVRVVVLRGRGAVFSSGIDHALLAEVFGATQQSPFLHLHHQLQDAFHRMSRLHQPVIAAVHGVCVGMALELVLAADVRIATDDCVLGLPEIAFGLVPDVGGTTRLVRAVGESRARELILTGRMLRARTAERYGLVHDVVDAAALDARVTARAEQLAALPPVALGLAKTLCQASGESDAATSFRLEGVVQQALLAQPDLMKQFPAALAFIKAQIAAAE
ncbi:MAG: enoyl-CoA hydratase/isomerase family protein [Deltaproteobacteria bacterium]|nr:enoyl-CoA hydratase/isomerase family protein [Deltaproteobacteria bacterium]MCW5803200.1 enoyl-CoA hydratase/isomerase family protein [Deltaproteobacteria bacterium]